MNVVSFCALRASLFPWQPRQGAHAVTVICKATFELAPGESPLAARREAVWDTKSPASDMAPFKRRADVLVLGHAHPPKAPAASALVAQLGVGTLQKAVEVRADRGWIAEGFGPVAPTSPARLSLLGKHAASWDARTWNTKPLPEDVDGAYFNLAPGDQQLANLAGDEPIVLVNLHPSYPRLETKLARVVPRVTVERMGGAPQEVRLRCDTLTFDTDRQLAMLVWRGVVLLAHAAEVGLVAVSMGGAAALAGGDVEATLPVVTSGGKNVPEAPVLPFVQGGPGLPSIATRDEATRAAPPPRDQDEGSGPRTLTHFPSLAASKPATPFEQTRRPAPVEVTPEPPDTKPFDVPAPAKEERTEARTNVPPMRFDVRPPALLGIVANIEAEPTTSRVVEKPAMLGPLAAFDKPPAEAPVAAAATSIEPAPTTEPAGKLKTAPEEPEAPIELTIEQTAAIAAELAEGKQERAKVLEAHALRERSWRKNERRWAEAIEAESARGTHKLRGAYDAAYVAKVESFRGPITLEAFTRLLVALERGKANEALDALRIQRPALMPIVRLWTRKVATDMKLGDAANDALRAARRA
ncbi:DUF2169 family type VI secretion system accessory protein [Polyangium jinanense]|uniref:DUF2169 domain-containing protein n=1 Tax=Polyangium jinanense TaxID=2829994 RepID=A0A9X3XHG0_9BACT|nr:DUF2169 domain-containing protein [Polyangium jinanense]MDC3959773.1 DUF2169 domain-containing protein [Polyangium jinanense]MDC3988081.1 DUF2169 domain-containing protein [Polyangium jinanense]